MTKYENVKKLCLKMKNDVFDERPDCEQILEDKNLWFLSAQEFNPRNELERVLNSNQNINNSYVFKLLEQF